MNALLFDPHAYDKEIDRMLSDMRVHRERQKKKTNSWKKDVSAKNKLMIKHEIPADIFTSMLERQKSLEDGQKYTHSLMKGSFLAAALTEGEEGHMSRCDIAALNFPPLPQQRTAEEEREEEEKILTHSTEDETLVGRLKRELRVARRENALLRREMYGTLVTIGRYLDHLSGEKNTYADCNVHKGQSNEVANLDDVKSPCFQPAGSAWELYESGKLFLSSEEAAMVRDLKSVIASCAERYKALQKGYTVKNACTFELNKGKESP